MTEFTATDAINLISDKAAALVAKVNAGQILTEAQFTAAFARTFDAMLTKMLTELDVTNPGLAQRLRAAIVAQYG